jgi:hypothetical protein
VIELLLVHSRTRYFYLSALRTKNGPREKNKSLDFYRSSTISLTDKRTIERMSSPSESRVDVLMIGSGEYTTGYVHGKASQSDKSKGGRVGSLLSCLKELLFDRCFLVVGLTLIDLRRRGKTGRLGICGTNGTKFPEIRTYMQQAIGGAYKDMDLTMDWWSVD